MPGLARLVRYAVTAARFGAGVAFLVLIVAVLVQVVGRASGASPVWTEELTRFALLYLLAFGAGLAFRSGDLVNVDIVCDSLPGRLPWLLRLLAAIATTALAAYLLLHTWQFVRIGQLQTSPALGLRMAWIHFSVWLLLAVLALFGALRIIGMLGGSDDGKPRQSEER